LTQARDLQGCIPLQCEPVGAVPLQVLGQQRVGPLQSVFRESQWASVDEAAEQACPEMPVQEGVLQAVPKLPEAAVTGTVASRRAPLQDC